MLACERDGRSHLLAVDSRGVIVVIRSLANMIPDMLRIDSSGDESLIQSVCQCRGEGDIIVAGVNWMKLVSIRLK